MRFSLWKFLLWTILVLALPAQRHTALAQGGVREPGGAGTAPKLGGSTGDGAERDQATGSGAGGEGVGGARRAKLVALVPVRDEAHLVESCLRALAGLVHATVVLVPRTPYPYTLNPKLQTLDYSLIPKTLHHATEAGTPPYTFNPEPGGTPDCPLRSIDSHQRGRHRRAVDLTRGQTCEGEHVNATKKPPTLTIRPNRPISHLRFTLTDPPERDGFQGESEI